MTQTVTLHGQPVALKGHFSAVGEQAKSFKLVAKDLHDVSLNDFTGKRKVLNIFPSIDTDICATSVRKFNQLVDQLDNTVVLCISVDLPFAQSRFCGAEGLNNVIMLSTLRGWNFKSDYGVEIADGPLEGLMSRAVIILDEHDRIIYSQLVPEIGEEPNYNAALAVLK